MRRTVRAHSQVDGEERLARVLRGLPEPAQHALGTVAEREDLPLVAGAWNHASGGCLVANVVCALDAGGRADPTLDLRVLELIPELSSRDLNRLIVAWDEAALQLGRADDASLRRLLRRTLARAGVGPSAAAGSRAELDVDRALLRARHDGEGHLVTG